MLNQPCHPRINLIWLWCLHVSGFGLLVFCWEFLCLYSWGMSLLSHLTYLYLYLKYISRSQHTVGSWVFSQSDNLCLLIGTFRAFILNVIIAMVRFQCIILLFFIHPTCFLFHRGHMLTIIYCSSQLFFVSPLFFCFLFY